jgi:HD-GYP domain-containing protein (c-di-GMP phosphodiesterase class II)
VRSARALVQAVDAKDGYTLAHSQRVAVYVTRLAEGAGLEPAEIDAVRAAAALHEVGRIGVPTAVLRRIGLLSEREHELLRSQTDLGRDLIAAAGMAEAASWVGHLHERWDGAGRPDGLAGEAIPLQSRILHLGCALDAMTSPPPSREPKPLRDVLTHLEVEAGLTFDPRLAATLVELIRSGELCLGDAALTPDVFRSLAAPLEGRPTVS